MSNYRETFSIASGHEINGLSRTEYEVADKYQIDCKIYREVIKTGWFSKKYEYNNVYSGEKENVEKAYDAIYESAVYFRARLNSI